MLFVVIIVVILVLVLVPLVLFLMALAASSFECLMWWAGWSRPAMMDLLPALPATSGELPAQEPDSYIVYLSGAGTMDPAKMDAKEVDFLDLVQAHLPGSVMVRDVFPFSPTNNPMIGPRWLTRVWTYALRARRTRQRSILQRLAIHAAQFRNTIQVGVSADRRYGPIHSYGVAQVTVASLLRHGYRIGSARPVIMMVVSGGGQVSVACVPILRRILRRPIWVLSVGSILTDDPGILEVEHLYHLSGSEDSTQHIGKFFYPGLWSLFPNSPPNLARKQGKVTVIDVGPMRHMKRGDYMSRSALLPDGQRHVDKTVDEITAIVHTIEAKAGQDAYALRSRMNDESVIPAADAPGWSVTTPVQDGGHAPAGYIQ